MIFLIKLDFMPEILYIVAIRNPFNNLPYIFASDGKVHFMIYDLIVLNNYKKIISFGYEEIIDKLRTLNLFIKAKVVDVITIKKLCVGLPKKEFKNDLPWSFNKLLGNYLSKDTLIWIKNIFEIKETEPKNVDDFDYKIRNLMEGFIKCFTDLEEELKVKDEYNRFYEIEFEIYNIFIKTQQSGICVSQPNLLNRLKELKKQYYSAIKKLEFKYSFMSDNISYLMNWNDINAYCDLVDFERDFNYDFWATVSLLKEKDDFLNLLLTAHESKVDYNELLKYKIDSYNRIYPEFDINGTVTSRILIKRPGIQFLKKKNRDIFIAQDGFSLLYVDYKQFEPGILASISGDKNFIELYNTKDVYNNLSQLLFGDVEHRKIAKTIFLSFIYGMSKDNIKKLITKLLDIDCAMKGLKFFDYFKKIGEWKNEQILLAERFGCSKSFCGNARYLQNKGESSYNEKRWIPNQIIQGTASFILKKSILELSSNLNYINFLIPMHDAILLEFPNECIEETKAIIEKIFINNFSTICPNITAGISFEEFAE